MSETGFSKGEARVRLNVLLRDVARATQERCAQAAQFATTVPCDEITDYHVYVNPENATACLDQVASRTRACFYGSVASFRREYEQLVANALAYNSPGHGRHAYKPIIGWSHELLEACVTELNRRRSELAAAERALKMAVDAEADAEVHTTMSSDADGAASGDATSLSSLEALVAACELAAKREGLGNEKGGYFDKIARSGAKPEAAMPQLATCPVRAPRYVALANSGGYSATPAAASSKDPGALQAAEATPAPAAVHSGAPKYRRHKSKVYIRPNKVVYLPTTFMEEHFEPDSLPINCEMIVETNGVVQPDRHMVTIKSVPRQGLATMYCMTNVMKFQQQFLNWQILNWTKVDGGHIQIHLQGPNGGGKAPKGTDTADAGQNALRAGGCVPSLTSAGALKRKSSGAAPVRAAGAHTSDDDEADDVHGAAAPPPPRPTRCSGRTTNSRYARRSNGAGNPGAEPPLSPSATGRGRSPVTSRNHSSGSCTPSELSHGHLLQPADDAMEGVAEAPPMLQLPPLASSPGAAYQFSLPMFTAGSIRVGEAARIQPQPVAHLAQVGRGAAQPPMPPLDGVVATAPNDGAGPAQLARMLQQLAASHPLMTALAGGLGAKPNMATSSAGRPELVLPMGPAGGELSPFALKRRKAEEHSVDDGGTVAPHSNGTTPAAAAAGRSSFDSSTIALPSRQVSQLEQAFSM